MAENANPEEEIRRLKAQLEAREAEIARLKGQPAGGGEASLVLGDKTTFQAGDLTATDGGIINLAKEIHQTFAAPDPLEDERIRQGLARQRYLERLARSCQALPLAALGGEEGADEDVTLDKVYINLDTTTRIALEESATEKNPQKEISWREEHERKTRALSALEAAVNSPRLALLGDPGAGKSTFVRRLLAWLAAAELGQAQPPQGFQTGLLPIYVVLRDLALFLAAIDLESLNREQQRQALIAAVRELVLDDLRRMEIEAFTEGLLEEFSRGRCLLVLDGLDEVPHDLRFKVRLAVGALIGAYQIQRIIVTCRIRSYTGEVRLSNFQPQTLAPFDAEKISEFAQAWYNTQKDLGRMDADQAQSKADDLAQAAVGQDLRELSSNPMMLTAMAIIHQKEIGLPRERVRLYALVVDVLLRRWQARKVSDRGLAPSAELETLFKDELRLRSMVERLAYEAHTQSARKGVLADLPRGEVLTLLDSPEYLGSVGLAAEFLDYVDQRAGLLVGRGGEAGRPAVYSFPHRTFQEYLAGCHLVGRRDLAREFYARAGEGDAWSLAARLGAEDLYYNRRNSNALLDLAYALCPEVEPQTGQAQRAALWSGQIAALLGAPTVEADAGSPGGGDVYLKRLRQALAHVCQDKLVPIERAEAGWALGKIGDPRLEALTVEAMQFCLVPAGPFWMGSDQESDPARYGQEEQQHELELPDFWISRFPVTNAQFNAFWRAGGYREERFWCEAQKQGFWNSGRITRKIFGYEGGDPKLVKEYAERPFDYGEPFNLPNHPVVGITWYEALAFARWLGEKLSTLSREQSTLAGPSGEAAFLKGLAEGALHASLPSEAEWEKAARGTDGRIYPWGREPNPDKANYADTGLATTSAVGCFPDGASPYGVLDLSGNVWEWTRSLQWGYPYRPADGRETLDNSGVRVLRGGAFDSSSGYVRCAYRFRNDLDLRNVNTGFRVVVSPCSMDSVGCERSEQPSDLWVSESRATG